MRDCSTCGCNSPRISAANAGNLCECGLATKQANLEMMRQCLEKRVEVGRTFDVIVAGAGISGMAAAIEAARAGLRVLVLEKDRAIGGNARWAFGFDIEGNSMDALRTSDEAGDPVLQRLLVAEFSGSIQWLINIGVEFVEDPPGRFNFALGQGDGGADAFARLATELASTGGKVLTETDLASLVVDDAGVVTGVVTGGTAPRKIRSSAVILATGGFGSNTQMKRSYLGPDGHLTGYYGSRCHDGDGIAAAFSAGAALTDGVGIPAGACIFPPPFRPPAHRNILGAGGALSREVVPAEIQALLVRPQIDGRYGILLNRNGQRYVDESLKYSLIGLATTRQPQALGFYIFDRRGHLADARNLGFAASHGAAIYSAETFSDLLEKLRGWRGIAEQGADQDSQAMMATIAAFNTAVTAGASHKLDPPAAPDATPLHEPPFYAMPIVQGVNDTAGGLAIDGQMRVLRKDGRPIPGLFAIGADGGRPYSIEHGGLGHGLVSGRLAGREVAAMLSDGFESRSGTQ